MDQDKYRLGMIGLGTMGRNLLLNMGDHGFAVAGYDKDASKLSLLKNEGIGKAVKGFTVLICTGTKRLETGVICTIGISSNGFF